jgi:8-oxo-dGTP pyrophosphatase MutT (NUDIX family)
MSFADIVVGFDAAMPQRRRLRALAGAILYDDDGRILLLHRMDPSQWELPGGKVEAGEKPEHAAMRELREELAVRVGDLEEVGRARFCQQDQGWSYTWFVAHSVDGRARVAERERFDAVRHWRMAELASRMRDLSPNVRELVRAYFEGRVTLPAPRHDPSSSHQISQSA